MIDNVGLGIFSGYQRTLIKEYKYKRYDSKEEALAAERDKVYKLGPIFGINLFYYF